MVRPRDTSKEVWVRMNDGLAKMTPAQRIARVAQLTVLAHGAALAWIRTRYPDETEQQHRLRLAARILPPDLMRAAFGNPNDRS